MVFPKWTNYLPALLLTAAAGGAVLTVFVFWYWMTDKHFLVGYQPLQPIAYSHKQHVNDLGMDCRYCHFDVERSSYAGVPPSEVCMNCHDQILKDSPEILKLKAFHDSSMPVPWIRIHKLPEYSYFDHSAHINKGVACVDFHGRVDQMAEVRHSQSLTMAWCLDCHQAPEIFLRDRKLITASAWKPPGERKEYGKEFYQKYHVKTRIDCSACHR
jgi:hypothetical protein